MMPLISHRLTVMHEFTHMYAWRNKRDNKWPDCLWSQHATMNRSFIFKQHRLKTGGQYSKVLRIPLNQALMPYTCSDVDWALFNFRLFLKLGSPSRFGAQVKLPPLPPPLTVTLTMNAFIWWHFILSILCFSK